jgi:ABC-type xylose transport system permease subunit
VKRLIRQAIAILIGGFLGGLVQFLIDPVKVPAIGVVIGGLLAFALSEGMKE